VFGGVPAKTYKFTQKHLFTVMHLIAHAMNQARLLSLSSQLSGKWQSEHGVP
jgi:hypothetical protein